MQSMQQLKDQLFELQDEKAVLQKQLRDGSGSGPGGGGSEVKTLRNRLGDAQLQLQEAEDRITDLEGALRSARRNAAGGGGSLRTSEDQYLQVLVLVQ
jgi:hypothetical protein